MAAPHVAGVAGLVWNVNPNLSAKQVKEIIVNNELETVSGPDDSCFLSFKCQNYKVLNANSAVEKALDTTPEGNQPPQGLSHLLGKVIDIEAPGLPIPGVSVKAFNLDNPIYSGLPPAGDTTLEDGSYHLLGLGTGKNFISFEHPDYITAELYENIHTDGPINEETIKLIPKEYERGKLFK